MTALPGSVELVIATTLLSALSAVAVGLMSGLYWAFTVVVMPNLRTNDDRRFIAFMQPTNRHTISIGFLPVFVGRLLLPVFAAIAMLAGVNGDATRWGIGGAVLAAFPVGITAGGSVPLNLALDRAGDVGSIDDPAAVRLRAHGPEAPDPPRREGVCPLRRRVRASGGRADGGVPGETDLLPRMP